MLQASPELWGDLDGPGKVGEEKLSVVFPDQPRDKWVPQKGETGVVPPPPKSPFHPRAKGHGRHPGLGPFFLRPLSPPDPATLGRGQSELVSARFFLRAHCFQNASRELGLCCSLSTPKRKGPLPPVG